LCERAENRNAQESLGEDAHRSTGEDAGGAAEAAYSQRGVHRLRGAQSDESVCAGCARGPEAPRGRGGTDPVDPP